MGSVSVVIRTYNRSAMLAEALGSVVDQTLLPDEVVVVDDGSTDDTPEIMRSFTDRFPFIKYLKLDHNVGMALAMEAGVGVCGGDLVAFLDSDDLWEPPHLEKAVEAFLHPSAVLAFSRYGLIDREGHVLRDIVLEQPLSGSPFEDLLFKRIVATPTRCVVKRRAIEESGGVPLFVAGDWVLNTLVAAAHPAGIVQLPARSVLMRMHASQSYGRPESIADLIAATDYLFSSLPPEYAALKPRVLALNWLHSAVFSWQAGRYSSAWRCLGNALKARPTCVSTPEFLSVAWRMLIPPALGRELRRRRYQPPQPVSV
jgi:glycosyltransferase involved in cell wall biosynthesis